MNNSLYHHGILGMKWGVRRYQNADGSLTEAGKKRYAKLEERDNKWAKKNYNKITKKARLRKTPIRRELKKAEKQLVSNPGNRNANGKLSANAINEYNRRVADLMNKGASDIRTPNLGKAVYFVAKRGEIGVHMALADVGYDLSSLKNGVWASGRVAYKKNSVDMA